MRAGVARLTDCGTGPLALRVPWTPGAVPFTWVQAGRGLPWKHCHPVLTPCPPRRIVLICAKRSLCAAFSVLPYGEGLRVR